MQHPAAAAEFVSIREMRASLAVGFWVWAHVDIRCNLLHRRVLRVRKNGGRPQTMIARTR